MHKKHNIRDLLSSLQENQAYLLQKGMKKIFQENPSRFSAFSLEAEGFLLDWSKCCVNAQTMNLLEKILDVFDFSARRRDMFCGKLINVTENIPALHTALRNFFGEQPYPKDLDVASHISSSFDKMQKFCEAVRNGEWLGASGKKIQYVVNIGIGGSGVGTSMAVDALLPYHDGPEIYHVSNMDGVAMYDILSKLNPHETLFIVSSKTFSTKETIVNANFAKEWMEKHLSVVAYMKHHFVAVTANVTAAQAFGFDSDSIFHFPSSVGGRYSIWSSVGLCLMIAIGVKHFQDFLDGGRVMDRHFLSAAPLENLCVVLGLIGYWHRVICQYSSRAIVAYDQRLEKLPIYLQQLDMESNGKRVTRDGDFVCYPTSPLIWGGIGTNVQHTFFQFLHQGTDIVPVEFLIAAQCCEKKLQKQHKLLLANCFAQAEALMYGRTPEEIREKFYKHDVLDAQQEKILLHRSFAGERPSITLVYEKLTPHTLGKLLALFEHRTFVEGILFNVNSFDQWGVELGKELAEKILPFVEHKTMVETMENFSSSTKGLVQYIHESQVE